MDNSIFKNDKENDTDSNIYNDINYDIDDSIDNKVYYNVGNGEYYDIDNDVYYVVDNGNDCQNEEMLDTSENNELLISNEELEELKEEYYASLESNDMKRLITIIVLGLIGIGGIIAGVLCYYF